MRPSDIFDILDLTRKATQNGNVFNPLFSGPPGVGKSHIVQAWAHKHKLPFIDLRIAYMEAPDLIGFPSIERTQDGRQITVHNIPEFLPTEGEGVLLLEEPNRGTSSVMNCLMQLLTDRKLHKYTLPKGWMIVGCINEGSIYETGEMDPALKNRFVQFNISYDKHSFLDYMSKTDYHKDIYNFIEANLWTFSAPESIGTVPGSKYISPRTWAQLQSVLGSGEVDKTHELTIYESILGLNVAKDFYNFRHDEAPVMFSDLKKHKKQSLKKLARFSDPNNYKNGMISLTVRDIIEDNTIEDDLLADVIEVLPVEQGKTLVHELEYKRKDQPGSILPRLQAKNSKIKELFRSVVNLGK